MTTILVRGIARLLLVPSFVIAAAVLVKGYAAVGDGFSAGAIAATGMVLQYLVFGFSGTERLLPVGRVAVPLAVGGLLIALLVAFVPAVFGEPLVTHVPRAGDEVHHLGTLELHSAVLFDLGVFLVVFGFIVHTIRLLARAAGQGAQ